MRLEIFFEILIFEEVVIMSKVSNFLFVLSVFGVWMGLVILSASMIVPGSIAKFISYFKT